MTDEEAQNVVSLFNIQANKRVFKELMSQHQQDLHYIRELENLLKDHMISIPPEISAIINTAIRKHIKRSSDPSDQNIPTVGSTIKSFFFGNGSTHRIEMFKNLTGRILPKTMTLLMGPPGCGKTTFLKALSAQLNLGSANLEGDILYNSDPIDCGKYLVGKVANYVNEKEFHSPTLTVRETLEFAFDMTTGGHHSYGMAKDLEAAEFMDKSDKVKARVNDTLKVLGLSECQDTIVGSGALRGVSGGQKRRVTLGEMLLLPRKIQFLDSISNGLDAATTYDIIQALRYLTTALDLTTVTSLLQPAPDVFYSFQDLILMSEGEIIYHGPTTHAVQYFLDLGYQCPEIMDVADFLQEIPSADGKRFAVGNTTAAGTTPPLGTTALVQAWKDSDMYHTMLEEMKEQDRLSTGEWPAVYNEPFAVGMAFSFINCLKREVKLLYRNTPFLVGRLFQAVIVGAIAGSLFNNIPVEDYNTMSGILFFSALFGLISSMSMIPIIFEQRAVFYKQSRSLFFPTSAYVMAQTIAMYPLQILETVIFITIVYWSVGLSSDNNGSRYFTFMFAVLIFSLCVSQYFRFLASTVSTDDIAQPLSGVSTILMVLFSGYIVPKSNIPPGWIWFYWLNPIAYILRTVSVNEFLAPDYDFPVCLNVNCSVTQRFGDMVLESRGNPTEQVWVWYGVAVLVGMYLFFLLLTILALTYIRNEAVPPSPITVEDEDSDTTEDAAADIVQIPFESVTFSFKDVWYTVKMPNGDELDLLKGVSGYFEPGTVTALMGSSGAGKTTLLDVLAGRKNTGEITGGIFVNGKPKHKETFRNMIGYVEQFDTLFPNDTAREAVEFEATLRLPKDIPAYVCTNWVTTVLSMLELLPLQDTLVGNEATGGMSFEQKKRVSIAVELVANPSILFLDEPTTGLDSRAAQVVIRCIKKVAAAGRCVVCTIHQPSAVIFDSFDSLLLLRRGGETVYFGELGHHASELIHYFEEIPGVDQKPIKTNPATWMLEVIGAGTGVAKENQVDFHIYYKQSALCALNTTQIDALSKNIMHSLQCNIQAKILKSNSHNTLAENEFADYSSHLQCQRTILVPSHSFICCFKEHYYHIGVPQLIILDDFL